MSIIILSIVLLSLLVISIFLLNLYLKSKKQLSIKEIDNSVIIVQNNSLSSESNNLRLKNKELENFIEKLRSENSDIRIINGRLEEKIKNIQEDSIKLKNESESQFKILAQKILDEKSKIFKETNEIRLAEILNPLKENIEGFKKSIQENYLNEAKERGILKEQIKSLVEVNENIGKEAKELAKALRGNSKMQGDWGEMILENILEKSGLTKDQEFIVQATQIGRAHV